MSTCEPSVWLHSHLRNHPRLATGAVTCATAATVANAAAASGTTGTAALRRCVQVSGAALFRRSEQPVQSVWWPGRPAEPAGT
jgi:hypothetical protein